MRLKEFLSMILIASVFWGMFLPMFSVTQAQSIGQSRESKMKNLPGGLKFSLSEGSEDAGNRTTKLPASTDPLSEGDTEGLLSRMPNLETEDGDKTDFAKRAGSLAAPKTGKRIPVKFPADESRDLPDAGNNRDLEVLRFSPEGEVGLAPDLSVSFSHPMVAVTSQTDASKTVPITLSPVTEGKWRWLGTKTLMFDTDQRFPMATVFKATVPAGTRSATGQILKKEVSWTFTTPPPKIEQHFPTPGSINTREEVMFIRFDQKIDPAAVLENIDVASNGRKLKTRLLTEDEIKGSRINYYAANSQPGRWLAFRVVNDDGSTVNALPADSPISVSVKTGTPSAEGPLTTKENQTFGFRTYGAFKYVESHCGWQGKPDCTPYDNWWIRFTNGIDGSKFDQSMVKIEPAIEGLNIYPSGNVLYFQGYKKGRTNYKVTIDASLMDIYGQELANDTKVTFKVGSAPLSLFSQGGFMTVLDPTTKRPYYSIYSTNHRSVKMKVYSVGPEHWYQFQRFVRYKDYDDGTKVEMPGRLIKSTTINIENKADEMVETRIDLDSYLPGKFGSLVIDIEPAVKRDEYDRTRILTWIQATQIGLDAFVDNRELVGFATELSTGKPLSGVELYIGPNGERVSTNKPALGESQSYFGWIWDWFSYWGSSRPTEIESFDPSGNPVELETIGPAQSNNTTENGVLRLPLPSGQAGQPNYLVARKGKDVAFLPENSDYYWQDYGNWYAKPDSSYLRWFVFDDRAMYRPKEEVSVKGYMRSISGGKLGDVVGPVPGVNSIRYSVKDPRNNEIAKGTLKLNPFGAFDLKFEIPDNANLGYSRVEFYVNNDDSVDYSHNFQIQEFRRPEFEVSSRVVTEAPHLVGGHANVEVEAKYYAGGGLANADVNWTVRSNQTSYTPPNRGDFIFGSWVPWWHSGRNYYGGGNTQSFKGTTDAAGKHNLRIDFESVNPPRPYTITASSSVQDVNRQTWSSSTSLLVHPADLYVGIRSPRSFVQKGEDIKIESIVSDIDGKLIEGRDVEIRAILKAWKFDKGRWEEKTVDEQFCTVKSATEAQLCRFPAKEGGRYIITALVMDDRERFNESEMTVWVAGGKVPPNRNVEQESVEIIPSGREFEPGDTAEILVIAPFTPAEGILTLRREGIVKTERFTMNDSSITLKIPIEESYLPNIFAQVDLVGSASRLNDDGEVNDKLAKRPAYASGSINLSVTTESRRLNVTAEPKDKTVEPAGSTMIDVAVTDHRGEPVSNSEVAVVVVDESVLALSNYQLADPMSVFYFNRGPGTTDYHSRREVLLGNPDDVVPSPPPPADMVNSMDFSVGNAVAKRQISALPSAGRNVSELLALQPGVMKEADEANFQRDGVDGNQEQINLRKNFDALAVFAPSVKTDSYGKAVVDVKLPDNLTRYRVMAVSVDGGKRFGKTESSITARQPLMVRPSAPRFMNFGDKIELPVVVQNQTDEDMTVNVAVRASNALLTNGGGRRVLVKANDREEVRFPVSADMAGTARFQVAVSSGKHSDAAEISLPVWTPATTEAFATYGTTDENGAIVQPVQAPGDVYSQFGGLEVTTSSTQLQELTDAFIYLYHYQFACTEQISSRMISIAALKDVLTAFKAEEMPPEAKIKAQFERDIKVLQSRQNSNGYFGLWRRDNERYKYPFVTAHTAHALILAKAKGYDVPKEMLDRVKPYLKDIEKHYDEWHRSPRIRWTISAYALYVRNLMGDNDSGKAKKLLAEATIEQMPFEALGWLIPVLVDGKNAGEELTQIKRFLLNRTAETAATAQFNTDYGDGAWVIMHSNRRADAVLLEAMLKLESADNGGVEGASAADLIPKLVRGLLDHRKKGRWSNTQENVFILLALDKYFQAYEKVTPNFVSRIWLGNAYAGEQKFIGRSIDFNQLEIPMSYLMEQGGAANLILDKQGAGRLYYRIGMKYAPKDLRLKPADYGFTVLRSYEAVDDPEDVTRDEDGTWIFKAGSRVRVNLTMVAQARRYHVALVDPLPAGLEILNPGLAVTEEIPPAKPGSNTPVIEYSSSSWGRGYYSWRWHWFEHQNFRDERAEAFSSLVWGGVYNYTYVARATTPGEFVVPPAKAEEMYHPETFGRTGTDMVRVK